MGQIELNCVLTLNYFLNRTAFHIETLWLCQTELFEKELFFK